MLILALIRFPSRLARVRGVLATIEANQDCPTYHHVRVPAKFSCADEDQRCNTLLCEENVKRLVQSFGQLHPRRMKLPIMLHDNVLDDIVLFFF